MAWYDTADLHLYIPSARQQLLARRLLIAVLRVLPPLVFALLFVSTLLVGLRLDGAVSVSFTLAFAPALIAVGAMLLFSLSLYIPSPGFKAARAVIHTLDHHSAADFRHRHHAFTGVMLCVGLHLLMVAQLWDGAAPGLEQHSVLIVLPIWVGTAWWWLQHVLTLSRVQWGMALMMLVPIAPHTLGSALLWLRAVDGMYEWAFLPLQCGALVIAAALAAGTYYDRWLARRMALRWPQQRQRANSTSSTADGGGGGAATSLREAEFHRFVERGLARLLRTHVRRVEAQDWNAAPLWERFDPL